MSFDPEVLVNATTWVIPVLLAITLHEAAHGWAAWRLGDDTAKRLGRVTANPIRHVDPMGTVVVPGMLFVIGAPFLFGWAKPVPVNFGRLRSPRRDMVLVAAAGPASNVVMAFVAALLVHIVPFLPVVAWEWTGRTLTNLVLLNLVLAVFNMIPLPPLDGGRVAVGLLPLPLARPLARVEPYGFLILILGLFLVPYATAQAGYDINPFAWIIWPAVQGLVEIIAHLAFLAPG